MRKATMALCFSPRTRLRHTTQVALLLAFVIGLFAPCARAMQTISGATSTEFQQAKQAWLDDNDGGSLPALAELAHRGNTAARILLSRIEITDRAPQAPLRLLSRAQWHALFRAPPGESAFAPSWLNVESGQGNAFAATLLKATTLGINPAGIEALFAAGETEAAEHLIRKIAVDGSNKERQQLLSTLDPDHELQPYLFGFRHAPAGLTTGATAFQRISGNTLITPATLRSADTAPDLADTFSDLGYQGGNQFPAEWMASQEAQAIADWTLTSPRAMPLAIACQRACSATEARACATLAFGLFGGYYEIIRLDSPLEAVIPQVEFLNSERAVGSVMRRIANARDEIGHNVFSPDELSANSQCLADAVEDWRMPAEAMK